MESKERQKEMDVFVIMPEQSFNKFNAETRANFKTIDYRESNEWENNKDDPHYKKLYKENKKTKKALQDYLFNKRHKK